MANRHQQFIKESWRTLTGDTSEIESIWKEVVGTTMPDHEKGHCLYLMGWWQWTGRREPPEGRVWTPNEYKAYLRRRFAPDPVKPPSGPDELPTGPISWLHTDISQWKITSTVTRVDFTADTTTIEHTKAGKWPVLELGGTAIEGNPWVMAKNGNRWYAATYEWLRPGQTTKGIHSRNIGEHIKVSPLDSWRPQRGEEVYMFVSAPARDGNRTVRERSQIVRVQWGTERELDGPEPKGSIYSDFLSWHRMNLLLPAYSVEQQTMELHGIKRDGYRDVDIYAYSPNDNPYREPHWKVDAESNPGQVITTLRLAKQAGLRTTLWCFGDELGGMSGEEAKRKLRSFVPVLDPHVTRYVLALEMNESWDSDTCADIFRTLTGLTRKDCYIHWTRGNNGGASFPRVKGIYYQYEGKTNDAVRNETQDKSKKWKDAGKEFIAGEFPFDVVKDNPQKAKELGDAVDSLVAGRANG